MEAQSTGTPAASPSGNANSGASAGRLAGLAHFTTRYRWPVIVAWLALTLFGGYAAGQLSSRWYQSLAVPGKPAYEGSQRTLAALGAGVRSPSTVVFHSARADVSKSPAVRAAMARAVKASPGALTSSYFSTGNPMYVSDDRHTTFLQVYLPGRSGLDVKSGAGKIRAAAAAGLPAGISVNVTGRDALGEASDTSGGGSSVLLEALIGGLGALLILLFVFGTLPAVLTPLIVAVASILNTFSLVWALTYVTDVSIIVQFLIALVGLGVAIDYALLMIFRFRDELREGNDVESSLVETMTHAGHSVIISGTTVAVGLLAMVLLPLPSCARWASAAC
jgi:RND superfamily putative drug exporter